MGYTTDFTGSFNVTPAIKPQIRDFINKLTDTRRMKRNTEKRFGVQGEFIVDGSTSDVVDNNTPPSTQPSLWCHWEISEDGSEIEFDGGEKFYSYTDWLVYIIEKILKPNGYTVDGEVMWQGEETGDVGKIIVENNEVSTAQAFGGGLCKHVTDIDMQTNVVYKPSSANDTKVKPTRVKLKLTIEVEIESTELDDVDLIVEQFTTETDYSFSDTDNVTVVDTEYIDTERI